MVKVASKKMNLVRRKNELLYSAVYKYKIIIRRIPVFWTSDLESFCRSLISISFLLMVREYPTVGI